MRVCKIPNSYTYCCNINISTNISITYFIGQKPISGIPAPFGPKNRYIVKPSKKRARCFCAWTAVCNSRSICSECAASKRLIVFVRLSYASICECFDCFRDHSLQIVSIHTRYTWTNGTELLVICGAISAASSSSVWELKLYFYPSAGRLKKKKKKKSSRSNGNLVV